MQRNERTVTNTSFCRFMETQQAVSPEFLIDATNNCQLACRYCYYGHKGQRHMDVRKVLASATALTEMFGDKLKSIRFHYMGGEPLLAWNRILQLNALARRHFQPLDIPFHWSMTSNLIALDERKTAHMIAEHAGIHCSLDGPAHIHDRNRPFRNGAGSFDRVMKNVPLALQITPHDTARVTVCPEDAAALPEIATTILDAGFRVVGLFPAYNQPWKRADIEHWGIGLADAFNLVRQKYGDAKRISTIVRPLFEPSSPIPETFDYCGAGKGLWAISVDGKIHMCHHFSNYPELAIIDGSSATAEEIRRAVELSTLPPPRAIPAACRDCQVIVFCHGGCWSTNFHLTGSSGTPAEVECWMKTVSVNAIGDYLFPGRPYYETVSASGRAATTAHACNCDTCQSCYRGCDNNECGRCDTCQTCHHCESRCETGCQSCNTCERKCEKQCESCHNNCDRCVKYDACCVGGCDSRVGGCWQCESSCDDCDTCYTQQNM